MGKRQYKYQDWFHYIHVHPEDNQKTADRMIHDKVKERQQPVIDLGKPCFVGENIAMVSSKDTANQAMTGWLQSPGHKENMEENFWGHGMALKKMSTGHVVIIDIFYASREQFLEAYKGKNARKATPRALRMLGLTKRDLQ